MLGKFRLGKTLHNIWRPWDSGGHLHALFLAHVLALLLQLDNQVKKECALSIRDILGHA